MAFVQSFPPVAAPGARVLVLGSMPGTASLAAVQYYAHPRNAFWPIVAALCGFAADAPYRTRLLALRQCGVALWDVLSRCERPGSLDSDIAPATAATNDFGGFLRRHRRIEAVLCNGGTAFRLFTARVQPALAAPWSALPVRQLPSTSPAHAGMRFDDKLRAWRAALGPFVKAAAG